MVGITDVNIKIGETKMNIVAIIPARGGSKRIPKKNIKLFAGEPIISYSIKAAQAADLFDRIIVSTDSEEIAEVAKSYGAEVPFMRPEALSHDHTPTRPVVNHAIEMTERLYGRPEYVCCLYATAPFVQAADLKHGLERLIAENCDFAFTVTSFASPIQRALKLTADGRVAMLYPEYRNKRSQDLEEAYHDAGQFYWGRTQAFLDNVSTFSDAGLPIILPRHRVQDIDTPEDWQRAELLYRLITSK